ncbi:MAG: cupredoxin domain-containing protein [Thermoleophilia bacterium]
MRTRRLVLPAIAAAAIATAVAGTAGGATHPAAGSRANPVRADADSAGGFSPRTITATAGSRVFFRNVDHLEHNAAEDVLSGRPRFRSGTPTTRNFSFVAPSKSGTYVYHCQIHGFMRGTLIVRRSPR